MEGKYKNLSLRKDVDCRKMILSGPDIVHSWVVRQ
jgi:hypothetical protein